VHHAVLLLRDQMSVIAAEEWCLHVLVELQELRGARLSIVQDMCRAVVSDLTVDEGEDHAQKTRHAVSTIGNTEMNMKANRLLHSLYLVSYI